jgi:ribosomal-protein-serine acetyltransferase
MLPGIAGTVARSDGTLEVREWEVSDAAALIAAIAESRDHLIPWMAWASGPPDAVSHRTERIRTWSSDRRAGGDGTYGMFLDGRVVGGCGLHRRLGPGGLEIGYWVHADYTRRGICTRVTRLLTEVAFADDTVDRVEVHHDAANVASGAVPRKLGYRMVGESSCARAAPADSGVEWRWRVTREEWFAPGGGHAGAPAPNRA